MDIVREPKVDWLSLKVYFLIASLLLASVGVYSLIARGLNLGVDFTGGTLLYVKFRETPELERIRRALNEANLRAEEVTRFDEPARNEVQIKLGQTESEEEDLTLQGRLVRETLEQEFGQPGADRLDLNNISRVALSERLLEDDPLGLRQDRTAAEREQEYGGWASRISEFRVQQSGLFRELLQLGELDLPPPLQNYFQENYYLGAFIVQSVEGVGPRVGQELQERAQNAVLFSLLGMLIYIAFRFQPVYGVAAIAALFHDVFLTVGLFSLTGKEISLTVIAGLLTVVGYSINDTIVIFDRVRENQKLMRRSTTYEIINKSVNQTLNRTIMTSGMTLLAVLALFVWGGEVLSGFSFALVVGIIVGTYSSVAIASPIVLWWENYRERRQSAARRRA
ncbi:MAG TPA: protein translocase subunit SecF [Acidobacteriota bacterium]|nr:protein translocase subunit SecF [Acidobacteriota bacterium]